MCIAFCIQTTILLRTVCLTPSTVSHSNVTAKRAHRRWIIEYVQKHSARLPALFYLDDKLPLYEGSEEWSYFTDDLLQTGLLKPYQLFSPNMKEDVVRDLQERGLTNVEHTCACHTGCFFLCCYMSHTTNNSLILIYPTIR
jgi:hypothetical protein